MKKDYQKLTKKVKNYLGATSEAMLGKVDDLFKSKSDCLLVHVGTNDMTNNVNLPNSVKKIVKKVNNSSPNTKLVFSSLVVHKGKKDVTRKLDEINFVDDNVIENNLRSKK